MTTDLLADDPIWGTSSLVTKGEEYTDALGTFLVDHIDEVGTPRDWRSRPIISRACPNPECQKGRVAGARASGKNCPECKGTNRKKAAYTRVTNFEVTDDMANVHNWRIDLLLSFLHANPAALHEFDNVDWNLLFDKTADRRDVRAFVRAKTEEFHDLAGGNEAAQRGSHLHALTEFVDKGEPLPTSVWTKGAERPVTEEDKADLRAYWRVVKRMRLEFLDIERLVINDELQTAGTLDRRVIWPDAKCCGLPMIADIKTGALISAKTGTVDFGVGKMAQQTGIYAHSVGWDRWTTERQPLETCPHQSLILGMQQGAAEVHVFTLDLEWGWDTAVAASILTRKYRREEGSKIKEVLL